MAPARARAARGDLVVAVVVTAGDASTLLLLGGFVATTVAELALAAPGPFFRYLAPLLPVCAVLMSRIVDGAFSRHVLAGGLLVAALVARQPLGGYLYEITHDFDGPVEGIVRYLDAYGQPGQLVAMTYEILPVKFYTRMRLIGGLAGDDLSGAREADWIVIRKHVISDKDAKVREYLQAEVPWDRYERIVLDYPDTPFENRESPQERRFRTATGQDRVVIHRRVRP